MMVLLYSRSFLRLFALTPLSNLHNFLIYALSFSVQRFLAGLKIEAIFVLEQAMKAQRGSRDIALLFL
jgi:hypothetical protein